MRRQFMGATWGLGLLLAAGIGPVEAQNMRGCGPHPQLVAGLAAQFGERLVAYGLATDGTAIEVYAGAGGSWTILERLGGGLACILDAGSGWSGVRGQGERS